MQLSPTTCYAVVRGGPSSEHDVSLKTGDAMLYELARMGVVRDIRIRPDGVWEKNGRDVSPAAALEHADMVFNALHGEYGEDGGIQRLFERLAVRYSGSGVVASALAMDKYRSVEYLRAHDVKVPHSVLVLRQEGVAKGASTIHQQMVMPVVIKPRSLGSSVGVTIARTQSEIRAGLGDVFERGQDAIAQEYLEGREATCGVIEGFRGEERYTLPVVEIRPTHATFFDHTAKYDGSTEEIVPGRFRDEERLRMQGIARTAHRILGLRHYSRTDFIVHPRRGIFVLEVNTLPGLTHQSLFPKALEAVGSNLGGLLEHVAARS